MMKITSLINTDLSNYFNYLNKDAWYYYNVSKDLLDQSGYLDKNYLEQITNNNNDNFFMKIM